MVAIATRATNIIQTILNIFFDLFAITLILLYYTYMLTKKRKKAKGFDFGELKNKGFFVLLFFLAFYLFGNNINIYLKTREAAKGYNKAENLEETLTKEQEKLNFELGKSYDAYYLEKIAREDLGFQKEGEQVIIVNKDKDNGETETKRTGFWGFVDSVFEKVKGILPE